MLDLETWVIGSILPGGNILLLKFLFSCSKDSERSTALDVSYRSGTVKSNTVNSKFHPIRIFYEVSVNIFSIISC